VDTHLRRVGKQIYPPMGSDREGRPSRANCRIRSSVSTGPQNVYAFEVPFAPALSGQIVSHALNDVLGKAALCSINGAFWTVPL
jgi:hypothetical protein